MTRALQNNRFGSILFETFCPPGSNVLPKNLPFCFKSGGGGGGNLSMWGKLM